MGIVNRTGIFLNIFLETIHANLADEFPFSKFTCYGIKTCSWIQLKVGHI